MSPLGNSVQGGCTPEVDYTVPNRRPTRRGGRRQKNKKNASAHGCTTYNVDGTWGNVFEFQSDWPQDMS